MVYIEELRLEDFLTHKNTLLTFSPFFNCIIGPTRSGKSCVVRALGFLFYNDWYEDYLRFGSKFTVVTAKLSNGVTVIRTKGKGINRVVLKTPKGDQRFEGFGFSLPEEVRDIIGVFPIEFDSKDPIQANVADQDELQFLLHARGPERTKVLSRLSGLHWIDFALKDLNKDRRTNSGEIQLLKDNNKELKTKLESFDKLSKIKKQLVDEKKRFERLKIVEALCTKGEALTKKVRRWKNDYQHLQELKSIDFKTEIPRFEVAIQKTNLLRKLRDGLYKLKGLDTSIKNMRGHINSLAKEIEKADENLKKEKLENPECPICGSIWRQNEKEGKDNQESPSHRESNRKLHN